MSFGFNGKMIRQSTGTENREEAVKIRKQKLDEIGADRIGLKKFVAPKRVTVNELLDALEADLKLREIRSLKNLMSHAVPVRSYFGTARANSITAEAVDKYMLMRRAAGRSPATCNRETFQLLSALRLGYKRGLLASAPEIRFLSERGNARQGFFERPEFERVVAELPLYLQDVARFGYITGWRRGEILTLEWTDVDRSAGEIRLRPEHSKNKHGRVVPLEAELADLIERRWKARRVGDRVATHVFHYRGARIASIQRAWRSACERAGVGRLLFHDLRRTAVRNMIRAGVPESHAMAITGHKTRSMFSRYNIVVTEDLRSALRRIQSHVASMPTSNVVRVDENWTVRKQANG
jgi:integrase